MKSLRIALPLAVSFFGIVWLLSQQKAISEASQDCARLKFKIGVALGMAEKSGNLPTRDTLLAAGGPVNWKGFAGRISARPFDDAVRERFLSRLKTMSPDELGRAIQEIKALGLSGGDDWFLNGTILSVLVQKDPEFAMNAFADRIGEASSFGNELPKAFGGWLKLDPGRATAWLDGQILAGKLNPKSLDGTGGPRVSFETAVVLALLPSDPAAAGTRIEKLTTEERATLLTAAGWNIGDSSLTGFVALVRASLPPAEQATALATQASRLAKPGNYSEVGAFLDRIGVTPQERAVCVRRAVEQGIMQIQTERRVTRDDIETMRHWVSSQSPGSTAGATGQFLATLPFGSGNQMTFPEVVNLVNEYQDADPSDDLLFNFLDNTGLRKREDVPLFQSLASKIADADQRAKMLNRLATLEKFLH